MAQWNRVPLIDYIELIGGGTPKTTVPEYWNGNIPWLSVKDFNNDKRYVHSTEKHISQSGFENSPTKMLHKDDIIISARGTVGEIAMIPFDMAFNQSCYGIRASRGIDQPFLYYLLKNCISQLKRMTHGSVFDTITRDTFANIEVDIPDAETQKRISSVLADIDNKIEVNDAINDNLQQQAQAIYSSMFIDNPDPAWSHGHLSDLITVKYGKDHKKLADGIYPVYGSGGIMRHVERPLYNKESVLIPRKGTLNNVVYVNQPFWSVDTMFYTEMKLPNVAKFVYHFVKAKDLAAMNAGSAVPSMTTDILNAMEVVIPSASALEEFESLVAPMYEAMKANDVQSQALSKMRDALLPKLMSGEIDVSAVRL